MLTNYDVYSFLCLTFLWVTFFLLQKLKNVPTLFSQPEMWIFFSCMRWSFLIMYLFIFIVLFSVFTKSRFFYQVTGWLDETFFLLKYVLHDEKTKDRQGPWEIVYLFIFYPLFLLFFLPSVYILLFQYPVFYSKKEMMKKKNDIDQSRFRWAFSFSLFYIFLVICLSLYSWSRQYSKRNEKKEKDKKFEKMWKQIKKMKRKKSKKGKYVRINA